MNLYMGELNRTRRRKRLSALAIDEATKEAIERDKQVEDSIPGKAIRDAETIDEYQFSLTPEQIKIALALSFGFVVGRAL